MSATALVLRPPSRLTIELDGASKPEKIVSTVADLNTPVVILLSAALIFLFYALNGLQITRVAAGNVEAESEDAGEKAAEYLKNADAKDNSRVVEGSGESAPEPTEPATTIVDTSEGPVAVFKLADLPAKVLRDAFDKWPEGESIPETIGDFEFASKRQGKGNFPWTVKFRGRRAVTVSYGGYGKTAATVTPG